MVMEMGRNHMGEFILIAGVIATILPIAMGALGYWGHTPASKRTGIGYLNIMKSVAWTATPGAVILAIGVVQWSWWMLKGGNAW